MGNIGVCPTEEARAEPGRAEAARAEIQRMCRIDRLYLDVDKFTRRWKPVHALEALARPNAIRDAAVVAYVIRQTANKPWVNTEYDSHIALKVKVNLEWDRINK